MDQFFESAKDVWLSPIGGALASLSFSWPNCNTEYSGFSSKVVCENVWGGVPWTPEPEQATVMASFVAMVFWVSRPSSASTPGHRARSVVTNRVDGM